MDTMRGLGFVFANKRPAGPVTLPPYTASTVSGHGVKATPTASRRMPAYSVASGGTRPRRLPALADDGDSTMTGEDSDSDTGSVTSESKSVSASRASPSPVPRKPLRLPSSRPSSRPSPPPLPLNPEQQMQALLKHFRVTDFTELHADIKQALKPAAAAAAAKVKRVDVEEATEATEEELVFVKTFAGRKIHVKGYKSCGNAKDTGAAEVPKVHLVKSNMCARCLAKVPTNFVWPK